MYNLKITITIFMLIASALIAFGQKEDAVWVFGKNAGIDFSDPLNPIAIQTNTYASENTSSISDSAGNLLFYVGKPLPTIEIMGADHLPISANATIVSGATYARGSVFIRFKENNSYMVVYTGKMPTSSCSGSYCEGLYYANISETDSGYVIMRKDVLFCETEVEEGIAVTKHSNGVDWWLVVHKMYGMNDSVCNNTFLKYLITSDSILGPFPQNIGSQRCAISGTYGEPRFSPDGTKLVFSSLNNRKIELFDFDRCSSTISNPRMVDSSSNIFPYSAEFSPSQRYLYAVSDSLFIDANPHFGYLYQYDLESPNIPASRTLIWSDGKHRNMPGQLQLAPNGKIYMAYGSGANVILGIDSTIKSISYINFPDSLGVSCGFTPFGFALYDSTYSMVSLPNMPNYRLGPAGVFTTSAGMDTSFCKTEQPQGVLIGSPTVPNIRYQWYPPIGLDDPAAAQPLASPDTSTWYYLSATDTATFSLDCRQAFDSVYVEVRTCTGISEVADLKAKVYPNPTNNELTVELPNANGQGHTLTLYNLLGQRMYEAPLTGTTTLQINIPSGLYLYQIHGTTPGRGQVQNGKLVVE